MTNQSEEISREDIELYRYFLDKVEEAEPVHDYRRSHLTDLGEPIRGKAKEFSDERAAFTELTDFLFDVRSIDGDLAYSCGFDKDNISAVPAIAKKIAEHYGANDTEVLGRVLETAKQHIADVHGRRRLVSHIVCQKSFEGIYENMMETILAESGSTEQAVERVSYYLGKMAQVMERTSPRHEDGGREGYRKMRYFLTSKDHFNSYSPGFKEMVALSKELSSTPEEFEEVYAMFATAIEGKTKMEWEFNKLKSVLHFTQAVDAIANEEGASREQRVAYAQRIVDGFHSHPYCFDGVYKQTFCDKLAEIVKAADPEKHPSKTELLVSTATKLAQEYDDMDYGAVNIAKTRGWIFRRKNLICAGPHRMFADGFEYMANSEELSGSLIDLVAEEKDGHSRIMGVAQGIGLLQLLGQEKALKKYLRANRSNPEKAREGLYTIAETAFARYKISADHVKRPGDYEVSNAERKDIIATAKRLAVKYAVSQK